MAAQAKAWKGAMLMMVGLHIASETTPVSLLQQAHKHCSACQGRMLLCWRQ
jgi:hypothetical protein